MLIAFTQQGSVYYGTKPVPMQKVEQMFPGQRVSDDYAFKHLKMMADPFDLPIASLYSLDSLDLTA